MSNKGNHYRIIYCSCGWSCKKHLKDANDAHTRHKKYCEKAKALNINANDVPVNNIIGINNGDFNRKKQNATERLGVIYTNEVENEVFSIDTFIKSKAITTTNPKLKL